MFIIRQLGFRFLAFVATVGRATLLLVYALKGLPRWQDVVLLIKQIYNVGYLSLVIIILSAFSIGAVLALQFFTQLARFGAQEAVGVGLALVVLRELGPVVTALLFAGRAGSTLTAEIGLMKTTEQLASMEMMGVDPLRRIVAPRIWAGLISVPILTEGILGARYVSLMPGSEEEKLSSGDEITDTQGALVLENLIGEFVTSFGES